MAAGCKGRSQSPKRLAGWCINTRVSLTCTGPLTSYTELLSSLLRGMFRGLEALPPLDLPSLEDPRVGFGVEEDVGLPGGRRLALPSSPCGCSPPGQ